jgi:hypothetical protein
MPNNEQVDSLIKEKFLCQSKFAQDIEYLVMTSKINYIEAICTYCEENSIEFESVSKLISKPLKEKLKSEATQLNFLKKTTRATFHETKLRLLSVLRKVSCFKGILQQT